MLGSPSDHANTITSNLIARDIPIWSLDKYPYVDIRGGTYLGIIV